MDNLFRIKNSEGMFGVALKQISAVRVTFGKNTSDEPHDVLIYAGGGQTETKMHTAELEAFMTAWNAAAGRN